MSEKQMIIFLVLYGILLVGIIIYYWRRWEEKGREEFERYHPELYKLNNDDTLTELQRDILWLQSFKRDNNRMAINISYNPSLTSEQRENLHKYIRENEDYMMKKREELVNQNKDDNK